MTGNSMLVVRSTGGPVAVEDELSERVREWCEALAIPYADISAKENPE